MIYGRGKSSKVGLQITVARDGKEGSYNTCTDTIQASAGALDHTIATPVQCVTWITSAIIWASTDTVSTPPVTLGHTPS
jgi:hypothetical protein